jgi:hypothetical protein
MLKHNLHNLIERHEAFLQCRPVDRPLVGCWVGGYYPAEQFPRGVSGWPTATLLTPQNVSFAPFAEDYEELYQSHRACDDDFFYTGAAYWGVPWLEAILGCPVSVVAANCRAEPWRTSLDDSGDFAVNLDTNPWLDALLRFTHDLVEFSRGRFPVCAPLLRGPGDAASAMLGGTAFVTGLLDDPERMKGLLAHCATVRSTVLRRLDEIIPAWHGTHAAGGYPSKVWCRKTVAYYQEDCAALLSPRLFREFLLPAARQACQAAEVNFIHLHSACLYPVDILLDDDTFDVLEINIDHGGAGPAVPQLIETFQKIQRAGRPLLLWGQCSPDDWELICRLLSPIGLSLQPMVGSPQTQWRNP